MATLDGRRWQLVLLAIVAVGVAVRIAYVLVVLDPVSPGLDADWYVLQGGSIREGIGYVVPASLFEPRQVATAGFPPVYPAYQALWQTVAGNGPTSVRLAGVVPGAATIALAGLLGRRAVGRRVGLAAAALVAVDPTLLAVDGSTMSENVTVPLVLAVVLLALAAWRDGPRPATVAALGLLAGTAALARQDLLLLVALVGAVLLFRPGTTRPRRLLTAGAATALVALVIVPWAWRNERAVGSFTVSTLSPSSVLAGANCDETYAGPSLGSWSFACVSAAIPPGTPTEVEVATAQREAATSYVGDHLGRVPLVVAARQARVWSFWDPRDLARRDAEESRRYGWQVVSRPLDAALAVVGATGLVVLVRRRPFAEGRLLLLVPVALVVVSATISHGNPRFAAIAHPVLAVGAAALAVGWFDRRRSGRPDRRPTGGAAALS